MPPWGDSKSETTWKMHSDRKIQIFTLLLAGDFPWMVRHTQAPHTKILRLKRAFRCSLFEVDVMKENGMAAVLTLLKLFARDCCFWQALLATQSRGCARSWLECGTSRFVLEIAFQRWLVCKNRWMFGRDTSESACYLKASKLSYFQWGLKGLRRLGTV